MSQAILKVRQLSHSYQEHKVFENFKFSLFAGDSVLLQGENGSGKTTMLKILSGLLVPDQGEFFISDNNQSVNYKSARQVLRSKSIYLHQQPFLFAASVKNNLNYAAYSGDVLSDQMREEIIDRLRLASVLDDNAANLSTGQKQRVALARSLIYNPQILYLDEPFTAMDKESFSDSCQVLKDFHRRGGTFIIVSHQHDRRFDLINNCWCIHPKGVLYCVSAD